MTRLESAHCRRSAGVTLIEMLVVLVMAGALLALVAPSVRELLAAQRVQSINAELVTNLQFARAEAVRRNAQVLVSFRSTATMSCYVMYVRAQVMNCDCRRTPGSACLPLGTVEEIKTVQIPRTLSVVLAASSAQGSLLNFDNLEGRPLGGDFTIDVTGTPRGALRTTVNIAGRPAVCSPDGSIRQVPVCEQ